MTTKVELHSMLAGIASIAFVVKTGMFDANLSFNGLFGILEATVGAILKDTSEGFSADGRVNDFSTLEAVEVE